MPDPLEPGSCGPEALRTPLATARVLIAGLGVTGRAVGAVLQGRVASVLTVDAHADADVHDGAALDWRAIDLVVVSPGWHPDAPLLVAAQEHGVPVWSEVELAWHLRVPSDTTGRPAPWVAVTGTNGKTTTVEMLDSILTADGRSSRAVGNVGRPLVEAAVDPSLDVLALELSSYQLHHTYSMSALAAAVLNVAPDHLDWHGSMGAYAAAKGRVYARVQIACVYPVGDELVTGLVTEADVVEGARAVGFTAGAPGRGELGLVEDVLVDRAFHLPEDHPQRHTSAAELATLADLAHLAGPDGQVPRHTVLDALAAAALARAAGASARAVRDGLRAFTTGRHRIEQVGVAGGVRYVDDSKATNAHAAQASLQAFAAGSVVWVAGGLAKGARFEDLVAAVRDRLRAVVLIGVDHHELSEALARHAPQIPVVEVDPGETETVMTRAVDSARGLAHAGDTVLLAPASASMDQFRSYADRGDAFARAVRDVVDAASADAR